MGNRNLVIMKKTGDPTNIPEILTCVTKNEYYNLQRR
jgi:hypothetical protein